MQEEKINIHLTPTWNWLPDPRQMIVGRNGNYFRSVVAGCLSPLFHLPIMIWQLLIKPVLRGAYVIASIVIVHFIAGLLGYSTGLDIALTTTDGKPISESKG